MLATENPKTQSIASAIVDDAIATVAAASNGEEDFAQLLRDYVRDRTALVDDSDQEQRPDVFVCHSSQDKEFVRRLSHDIAAEGYRVWYAEWEMQVGDSLYEKIEAAVKTSRWFMIVLSESSVNSQWCKRELRNAYVEEDEKSEVFILPVLREDCELPGFLKEKFWADCRAAAYGNGLRQILRRLQARV